MEISLGKKHFAGIALFCIMLTAGFVVANSNALSFASPSTDILPGHAVGHSSEDVVVNLDDLPTGGALCTGDMALQEAIDNGCFGTGGAHFGDWVLIGSNISGGTVYGPAATDGIVTAIAWDGHLQGYTDSSSNPSTMVIRHNLYHSGSGSGITMPVKKGHYWKVNTQGGDAKLDVLYWIPMLSGKGGMPDEILTEYLETGGDSRNAENLCNALSNASRECHYGAGMDNDSGAEYIYCWCWNT